MTSKRKVILPIIVAAMLLCQACGDVLTPATPMSTEDELTLLGEGQPSEASVSETSVSETSTEESISESNEASVSCECRISRNAGAEGPAEGGACPEADRYARRRKGQGGYIRAGLCDG